MSDPPSPAETPPSKPALRVRYRIRFTKQDLLRWISHRDLIRLWERMIRRAALPLSMTEGFSPKPRIAFPSALALGVVGLDEVVELELREPLGEIELLERLQADAQPGLNILAVERVPEGRGKPQLAQSDYLVSVPESADRDQARSAIARLQREEVVTLIRKEKPLSTHVASEIPILELTQHELRFSLVARDQASLRPDDVLQLLGLEGWPQQGATITRARVHLRDDAIARDDVSAARRQPLSTPQ